MIWPGCYLPFCQSPPDHIYPSGGFSLSRVNWVKHEQESDKSLDPSIFQKSSMRRSCITSNFFLPVLETSMYFSGIGMILLSASKVWIWFQRVGGIWSFLTWTKNHFLLHQQLEVNLEVVEVESLLTLQENLFDFLLELGDPVSRWMFSVFDLFQQSLIRPSSSGNKFSSGKYYFLYIESSWVDFRRVHRLHLSKVGNQHVTLPNSSRVQSVSEEQSR